MDGAEGNPAVTTRHSTPRESLDSVGLLDVPENAVDVDLLLGEPEHLNKGIGSAALAMLVARLRANPALPLVGLTSSVENRHAHRAFEKAGFTIARQCAPSFGLCHLFVLPLHGGWSGSPAETAV